MLRSLVFVATLALCLGSTSCVMRKEITGQEASGLDKKLSLFAYIEEGNLVTLIVDTKAARDRDGHPYMPLEIAIANRGLRQLILTRESFILRDAQGNSYPAASPKELIEGYTYLDFDRNLAELDGIIYNRFGAMARYPSNFSPTGQATRLVRDLVSLPKHGYLLDFIYFPTPPTGIRDQRFELFMDSPDLPDPVFVKFEVR